MSLGNPKVRTPDIGTAAGTTVTGAAPTGAANGDEVWAFFISETGSGNTPSLPSGWTQVAHRTTVTNFLCTLGYVVRDGTESYAFGLTQAGRYYELYLWAQPGGNTTSVVDDAGTSTGTDYAASATPVDPPAATANAATDRVYTVLSDWTGSPGSGWSPPSGYTMLTDGGAGTAGAVAYKDVSGTGSQDPGSWVGTLSGGDVKWATTITIKAGSVPTANGPASATERFTAQPAGRKTGQAAVSSLIHFTAQPSGGRRATGTASTQLRLAAAPAGRKTAAAPAPSSLVRFTAQTTGAATGAPTASGPASALIHLTAQPAGRKTGVAAAPSSTLRAATSSSGVKNAIGAHEDTSIEPVWSTQLPGALDWTRFATGATGVQVHFQGGASAGAARFAAQSTGRKNAIASKLQTLRSLQVELLADAPVGYWRRADGQDSSGHALHLTPFNDAAGGAGYPQDAASLILTAPTDPGIAFVPGSNLWNPEAYAAFELTAAVSLSFWAKPASIGPQDRDLARKALQYGTYLRADGRICAFINQANGVGITTLASSTVATAGVTYHAAMAVDVAAGTFSLFVNGQQEASVAITSDPLVTLLGSFVLGEFSDNAHAFDGTIDEVALYNTALAPTRLLTHYQAGVSSSAITPGVSDQVRFAPAPAGRKTGLASATAGEVFATLTSGQSGGAAGPASTGVVFSVAPAGRKTGLASASSPTVRWSTQGQGRKTALAADSALLRVLTMATGTGLSVHTSPSSATVLFAVQSAGRKTALGASLTAPRFLTVALARKQVAGGALGTLRFRPQALAAVVAAPRLRSPLTLRARRADTRLVIRQ
jgi:hypothetical protein